MARACIHHQFRFRRQPYQQDLSSRYEELSSDADQALFADDGRKIFASANEPKKFVLLHGHKHNALYRAPSEDWWNEALEFIHAPLTATSTAPPS